ncbi:hypothetical protein SAMN05660772_01339 [Pasteurella testudinis DSM 23072]|uniref:Uncharacterized protein n=1 Tax=Pasteurella testudinis DSM 23072 TaxID=1122938 RepID=A0A1W1V8G8_9PAST|nr:hypothetical protein [Pasteurella testudinis]SMB89533.1 hypothetical protein SAMN05660772_01339 [Pasteurella testudinis DSM 23072]SUB52022.1 Uncharacterised protein [Pasteurella testudinis]
MKKLSILGLALFLAACSSVAPPEEKVVSYNPLKEARVRLYGQNNYFTWLVGENVKIRTGGIGDAPILKEIFTPLRSSSIGMPKTELIKELGKKRSSIYAELYYQEHVVPAGVPYEISTSLRDGGMSNIQVYCSVNIHFTPKAGKDYEVPAYIDGRYCILGVNEIVEVNGEFISIPHK